MSVKVVDIDGARKLHMNYPPGSEIRAFRFCKIPLEQVKALQCERGSTLTQNHSLCPQKISSVATFGQLLPKIILGTLVNKHGEFKVIFNLTVQLKEGCELSNP